MAAASTTHKSKDKKLQSPKNGLTLVWLDDSAEQDSEAKMIFLSLFEQVFCFADALRCFELVESADPEPPSISVLVSGRYGQAFAQNRFQPLSQVKDIYVYCMDIAKHNQWAQLCDKVRCVDSDLGKILQRMQHDSVKATTKPHHPQPMEVDVEPDQEQEEEQEQPAPTEVYAPKPPERFQGDNNIHDQLALHLLLRGAGNPDDGVDDFQKYCRAHPEDGIDFKPDVPMEEWFERSPSFAYLNATDYTQLWTLRWFIRTFYRQLENKYQDFIRDPSTFTVHYGTLVNAVELDKIKQRIGKIMIFNQLLVANRNKHAALRSLEKKTEEQAKYKLVFEINIDAGTANTVPFAEVVKDEVLIWFGSRHRLVKIEYVDQEDPYWIIGLSLCPTLHPNQSVKTLYEYYWKNLSNLNDSRRALGRLLMYKGFYYQAEKWFEGTNHFEELAELAIRENQGKRAHEYLEHAGEDSSDADLLRAYLYLLTSNDNIAKGRTLLKQICSDATDRIVRARANIALGFISLVVTQQPDQALEYFTLGNGTLCKNLPDIHPDVAISWIGMGYAHFVKHNFSESEKCFQTALQIQKQTLSRHHPDFAKTRSGLARCLLVRSQTAKQGLQELGGALGILMRTFYREFKNHPQALLTRNDIERAQKGKELRARNTLLDYI